MSTEKAKEGVGMLSLNLVAGIIAKLNFQCDIFNLQYLMFLEMAKCETDFSIVITHSLSTGLLEHTL